jgi:hypothetical protein
VVLEVSPDRGITAQTEQLVEDLHGQRLGIGELRCEAPVPEPYSTDDPVKTVADPQIYGNQLDVGIHLEPSPSGFPEGDLCRMEAPSCRVKSRDTGGEGLGFQAVEPHHDHHRLLHAAPQPGLSPCEALLSAERTWSSTIHAGSNAGYLSF